MYGARRRMRRRHFFLVCYRIDHQDYNVYSGRPRVGRGCGGGGGGGGGGDCLLLGVMLLHLPIIFSIRYFLGRFLGRFVPGIGSGWSDA